MTLLVDEAVARGRRALAGAGVALPDLEAQLLLAHAWGTDRPRLIARGREPLSAGVAGRYRRLLEERAQRVPLHYLTGEREFWSLSFTVSPAVLLPRPETERIVEAALEFITPDSRLAEIGTGSGAIVISLAREVGGGPWWATDCCPKALAVARANATAHGVAGRIRFGCGDLFAPLAGLEGGFDLIVSNPPYVPTDEIERLQPEVRDHEPRRALDGGRDGLSVITRLLSGAPRFLRTGGVLMMEIGAGQAESILARARATQAYDTLETRCDLAGIERVVIARRASGCRA